MKVEPVGEEIREPETNATAVRERHLLDLLIILSKRRKFIFGISLGAAVLAAVVVFLLPSQYTATTLLLPPAQNTMSTALLGQLGGSPSLASYAGASFGIKNPSEMYVSLFRSRSVEDAVVQRFGLMNRYGSKKSSIARKEFESRSTVSLGPKDGLIRITVTDTDPKQASEIANGYVDEFRRLSARLAITEAGQRRVFFEQQLLQAKDNLAASEEAMKRTEQSTGILQIDSQARSLIESAAILRGQVVAKEVQIQSMRAYATEDNPELLMAKRQLAALQTQLSKLSGAEQDSNSLIVPKGKVPEAGMEYIRKLRDVKYHETIFELIAKQFEMAKLDEARQGSVIQVADVAVPPDKKSSPQRTLTTILVMLIGFFASSTWCIVDDRIQRMKQSPTDRQRLDALRATFRRG